MKRTYNPSKIKRRHKHGFRKRNLKKGGRKVIKNRRKIKRKRICI
ncbi:50S ribosomal protein L34 [Candidatus Vidania fulgoroideorum]